MTKVIVDYIRKGKSKVFLKVDKNENIQYVLIGFVPGEKRVELELRGKGAEAEILGIIVQKKGETNIKTLQNHKAADTKSNLLIKSVVFNKARLNYQGLIKVAKKAQNTNAYQENKNLLMGDNAHVDTKPDLEILANEVRCTHGSTVGRLDQENLFYLMSRGLSRKNAEKIMIEGFLIQAIEKILDDKTKDKLIKTIRTKLN
jgi:Fe-S cluster assembly protein SufD